MGIILLVVFKTFGVKSDVELPKTEVKVKTKAELPKKELRWREANRIKLASKLTSRKSELGYVHKGFTVYTYRYQVAEELARQLKGALPFVKKVVPATAMVILALYLGTALYGMIPKSKGSATHHRPQIQKGYEQPVVQTRWVLTWVMPDGVNGINSYQRSISMDAVITQNNQDVMELYTPGNTKFYWDKREKYGEWHDAKGASGQWRLEGDKGDFRGEVSDNMGTFIPMKLERRS